jgi:hypothetical protein
MRPLQTTVITDSDRTKASTIVYALLGEVQYVGKENGVYLEP